MLIFKEGQPATAQIGPELELSKQILDGVTTPNAVGESVCLAFPMDSSFLFVGL